MAGEAQQICEFIETSLKSSQSASLVEAMAHFDWFNHVIPTTKQFNRALAKLSIPVTRPNRGMHLEVAGAGAETIQLTDQDMLAVYNQYIKSTRARRQRDA